ncbi:VOC family protein [Actinoplanes sp. NEAU-A12]|uniref:2-oxoadipate dioxygenase/decarboxylase n=1 Tax=Actinoplanes sandaracinus TaxID=3045177 RepID=A0ABT6X1H5_9ACTN|nr:VOC family protein [Actinoplanes sandaracinus]MDI6105848.1 VOC family protein [Actinoplanes sandaracinus]
MTTIPTWRLRAAFARDLSTMYGYEVPAYNTLVQVSEEVNRDVVHRDGAGAQRLGSIERITAERHGAIRVGTPAELGQVARVFGALGMRPVGFYDLREAARSAVPVISTAFRPVDADELALNPFRVFTSMLTPADQRFFSPGLRARLETFLAGRQLFGPELLDLADRAEQERGLPEPAAARFLELAVGAFELSAEPVDRAWYAELEAVSAVAADIGGVRSTHINHLTPRVLDIDELYRRMTDRGIEMIDAIQGPPRWRGPDVLLRQTSFRALAEPRTFREADGTIAEGTLRVRFGEVEARGIALTPAGRSRYDTLLTEVDRRLAETTGRTRADVAVEVWEQGLPDTERGLREQGLAYFTYTPRPDHPRTTPPGTLDALVDQGWVTATPIVYEDFLPRSAAGIFQSNLSGEGSRNTTVQGVGYDQAWLSGAIGRDIHNPFDLYAGEQAASVEAVAAHLNLPTLKDVS